jgi:hypothetical protein
LEVISLESPKILRGGSSGCIAIFIPLSSAIETISRKKYFAFSKRSSKEDSQQPHGRHIRYQLSLFGGNLNGGRRSLTGYVDLVVKYFSCILPVKDWMGDMLGTNLSTTTIP